MNVEHAVYKPMVINPGQRDQTITVVKSTFSTDFNSHCLLVWWDNTCLATTLIFISIYNTCPSYKATGKGRSWGLTGLKLYSRLRAGYPIILSTEVWQLSAVYQITVRLMRACHKCQYTVQKFKGFYFRDGEGNVPVSRYTYHTHWPTPQHLALQGLHEQQETDFLRVEYQLLILLLWQIPDQSNLKRERFVLDHSLRRQSPGLRGHGGKMAAHLCM